MSEVLLQALGPLRPKILAVAGRVFDRVPDDVAFPYIEWHFEQRISTLRRL
ncbi:hypothetical protein [Bosea sp. Tri-44]|uniref:hypothetical protein n=1 Tax=Bosea sp. Tri-44 TaxID=1972137 RepID=UPI0013E99611|nr:hypothetical protein [Bosea sp. Tri-44]